LEEVKPRSTLVKFYWCAEKTILFVLISWKAAAIQSTASVYIMNAGNWKLWKEKTLLRHGLEMQTSCRLVTISDKTSCDGHAVELASLRRGPGSLSGQSTWNVWWEV
jgi:hypothetical protein